MTTFPAVVALDRRRHSVEGFECGKPALDRWLRAYASQSQRRDAARTFVTAAADGSVLGYYTLVAGRVEHESATDAVRKGMSRHFPIPVAIIARLAVHRARKERAWDAVSSSTRCAEFSARPMSWLSAPSSSTRSTMTRSRSTDASASTPRGSTTDCS